MKLIQKLYAVFAAYTAHALAAWGEFGGQLMVPGFRSNSSYIGLGSARYVFVQQTGAYAANLATNATSSTILGVSQTNPDVQEAMSIAYAGPSKIVAGGALSAGAIITTNASGRAAAVASGQMACGRLLEAAGADGDIVSAVLFHPIRWAGAA